MDDRQRLEPHGAGLVAALMLVLLTFRIRSGIVYLTSKDTKQLDKRAGGELHLNKQPTLGR